MPAVPTLTHHSDIVSDIPSGNVSVCGTYILAFYLAFFLTYALTFYLTFYLASVLTCFLANILTCFCHSTWHLF